jgi:hypothetical protein
VTAPRVRCEDVPLLVAQRHALLLECLSIPGCDVPLYPLFRHIQLLQPPWPGAAAVGCDRAVKPTIYDPGCDKPPYTVVYIATSTHV